MDRKFALFSLMVSSCFIFNCSPVQFSQDSKSGKLQCFSEGFQQPNPSEPKLDVVFVTDTSGSLDEERKSVANGILNFIEQLPSNGDYRIAVVLAHGSKSPSSGLAFNSQKTFNGNAETDVLQILPNSTQAAKDIVVGHMNNKLSGGPDFSDNYTDGGEVGLYSIKKAIDGNLNVNRSKGIFRANVPVTLVFVADENDICSRFNGMYPNGFSFVDDPNGMELGADSKQDCEGRMVNGPVTINNVKTSLSVLNAPVYTGGILYLDNDHPQGGENEKGYGYTDFLDSLDQTKVDRIELNFSRFSNDSASYFGGKLGELGNKAKEILNLQNSFQLAHGDSEIIPGTLKITIDGKPLTSSGDFILDSVNPGLVRLNNLGGPGSQVKVDYCLK